MCDDAISFFAMEGILPEAVLESLREHYYFGVTDAELGMSRLPMARISRGPEQPRTKYRLTEYSSWKCLTKPGTSYGERH